MAPPTILATSIPYSDGWNIVVDGELTETITVNTAFVGCYLPEGEHEIEIFYEGKSWLEANMFKIAAFILAIVFFIDEIYGEKRSRVTRSGEDAGNINSCTSV